MLSGLNQAESLAVQRLGPRLVGIIADEWDDPESRAEIKKLLRKPDPAAAISRKLSEEISEGIDEAVNASLHRYPSSAGVEGFGKIFKKVAKVVKKVAKVTHAPIFKIAKRYAPIIVPIAGAVLAPFTGGASLAAAAAISAGLAMKKKRDEAMAARKASKAEASQMEAAVRAQEADVSAQADAIYNQYSSTFVTAGITPDMWHGFSVDAKLGAIDKLSRGELQAVAPATSSPVGPSASYPSAPYPYPQGSDQYADAQGAEEEGQQQEEAPPEPGASVPAEKKEGGFPWLGAGATAAAIVGAIALSG